MKTMGVEAVVGNKVKRANRRRSRNSNKKNQRASLGKIKIGDLNEFPPLHESVIHGSPESNQYTLLQSSTSVTVGGTTYYEAINVQSSGQSKTLDATAPPFQSAFTGPSVTEAFIEESAHGTAQQEENDNTHCPGDAFLFQCPLNYTMDESYYERQFIHAKLQQAVNEHRDLQQKRSKMSNLEILSDDFTTTGILDRQSGTIAGKLNTVYLACHNQSGKTLVVRRVHGLQLRNVRTVEICEQWKNLRHPNIVQLWSITTSYRTEEKSVLFAYDYHLNAQTLVEFSQRNIFREKLVWSFSIQLVNALLAVHKAGLAVKTLDPCRVMVTGVDNCTVRINCVAMAEVIEVADIPVSVVGHACKAQYCAQADNQRADLRKLGEVIQFMIDSMQQRDSIRTGEISQFAKSLMSGKIQTIDDALQVIGPRVYCELATVQTQKDVLEGEILKEADNGRLLRIAVFVSQIQRQCRVNKLLEMDVRASCAIRFGDALFGEPCLLRVINELNKLDVGADENSSILLTNDSFLTYKTLKEIFLYLYETLFCCGPPSYYPVQCPSTTAAAVSHQSLADLLPDGQFLHMMAVPFISGQEALQQQM